MAADLDNLGGVIGAVLGNVRPFNDSWGIPGLKVSGRVLRSSHPDWKQHELEMQAQRPEFVKRQELVNERLLNPLAPPGFRAKKKLSEAQAHAQLVEKSAQLDTKLRTEVLSLRERKPGIASILCKSLSVNGDSTVVLFGSEYDLETAEGRQYLMSHLTWEFEQEGERVEMTIPVYKTGDDGQPLLDDDGEPIKNDCGGWNIGDAIAWLIESEADETEKFVRARKVDALERSGGASTGPSASGSQNQSLSEEP